MPENRRTDAERASHLELMMQWQDAGFSSSVVAALAQSEFKISRQQAWRDLAIANNQRASFDAPKVKQPRVSLESRDATINLIQIAILKASMREDFRSLTALSKELRSLLAMGAREPCRSEPLHKNHNFTLIKNNEAV